MVFFKKTTHLHFYIQPADKFLITSQVKLKFSFLIAFLKYTVGDFSCISKEITKNNQRPHWLLSKRHPKHYSSSLLGNNQWGL